MNNNFKKFLIEAKKQTYANSNIEKRESSRLGSSDYHYEEKIDGQKLFYHDTYFGGTKFMGEEVVYCDSSIPEWGMNYYGIILDETLSDEIIDKALRPALMRVGDDATVLPVRGPSKFENGDYVYTFKVSGTLNCFEGIEEIYCCDRLIYKLICHGGIIQK